MLRQTIQDQLKQAMKNKDKISLDSIRFIWAQIKNAEIDKKADLTDQEIQKLITKEVKVRKEVIQDLVKAGRDETVKEENAKLDIIEAFLPEQMSEAAIDKIIAQVTSSGEKDFGKIMGAVMAKTKGQADGAIVSKLVKTHLKIDDG